jgi:hypothetical protein
VKNPLLVSGKRKASNAIIRGKKGKKHKKEILSYKIDFSNIDCKNACEKGKVFSAGFFAKSRRIFGEGLKCR